MGKIKIDKIIRSKRKTISLVILPNASLVVRAPIESTLEYINKIVSKKSSWIKESKQQVKKRGINTREKEYVNGEGFLFLGKAYKLKIQNSEEIKLGEYLFLPKKFIDDPRTKLIEWYRERALEKITDRVNWFSKNTGWKYKTIKISNAQTRWGSCGPKGTLNFSWRLVMAPVNIIDYVVVHELAHTQEKTHSIHFHNKIKTVLTDYEKREKWLKEKGGLLKL